MTDNVEIVRRYVDAVTQFDAEAALPLLHPDMHFHELPNRIRPAGGVDDVSRMMTALRRSGERKVLTAQRYIVGEVIDAGDRVVVEARWEGDVAIPIGKLQPGDTMVAHICMVFRLLGGRIIEQRNYDCYEDFGT